MKKIIDPMEIVEQLSKYGKCNTGIASYELQGESVVIRHNGLVKVMSVVGFCNAINGLYKKEVA